MIKYDPIFILAPHVAPNAQTSCAVSRKDNDGHPPCENLLNDATYSVHVEARPLSSSLSQSIHVHADIRYTLSLSANGLKNSVFLCISGVFNVHTTVILDMARAFILCRCIGRKLLEAFFPRLVHCSVAVRYQRAGTPHPLSPRHRRFWNIPSARASPSR